MTYLAQRNPIASTSLNISPLGLGTVKIGRDKAVKYPQGFTIPDDKQVIDLLTRAWDLGINLIDTAPAYGRSEHRLGQLLPKIPRDWVIATKAGEYFDATTGESHYDFTPESLTQSIDESLNRLNRDVLDIVLIHSNGEDETIIQQGALGVLAELKSKGKIRAIGMSTKTVNGGIQALQQSDIVMVTHNLAYQGEQAVIDKAAEFGKAVFIKKAFASGHLAQDSAQDPIQASFEFLFSERAISSVIVGTINPAHLEDNVKKAVTALSS